MHTVESMGGMDMSVMPYDPMKEKRKRLVQWCTAGLLVIAIALAAARAWRLITGFISGLAQLVQGLLPVR